MKATLRIEYKHTAYPMRVVVESSIEGLDEHNIMGHWHEAFVVEKLKEAMEGGGWEAVGFTLETEEGVLL